MGQPTRRQIDRFWESIIPGRYACYDCGKVDSQFYVQPQHPMFCKQEGVDSMALCGDCIGTRNAKAKERSKAQLAQEARCEVAPCARRGNWRLGGVLLCGRHKAKALRHANSMLARSSMPWVPMGYDRMDILQWAQEE